MTTIAKYLIKFLISIRNFCYEFAVSDDDSNKEINKDVNDTSKKIKKIDKYRSAYKKIKEIRNYNHHSFLEINIKLKYETNKDMINLDMNSKQIIDFQKKIKYINKFVNIIHLKFENLYNKILTVKNIENDLSVINCLVIKKQDDIMNYKPIKVSIHGDNNKTIDKPIIMSLCLNNDILIQKPVKVLICLDNNKWINMFNNMNSYYVKFEHLNNTDNSEKMIILKKDDEYRYYETNKFYNYGEYYEYLKIYVDLNKIGLLKVLT